MGPLRGTPPVAGSHGHGPDDDLRRGGRPEGEEEGERDEAAHGGRVGWSAKISPSPVWRRVMRRLGAGDTPMAPPMNFTMTLGVGQFRVIGVEVHHGDR